MRSEIVRFFTQTLLDEPSTVFSDAHTAWKCAHDA